MTLFALVLALAACIGWTAHARELRRALHNAWDEIDELEAKIAAEETPLHPDDSAAEEPHQESDAMSTDD